MRQRAFGPLVCAVLALACVAGSSTAAFAQGGGATTTLSGTVSDPSGAVIPGAAVVVKNNATATEYNATTNEQGTFTVPAVDPGGYTVTVTLMGFKTAVLNNVQVLAATPALVRVTLEVGGFERNRRRLERLGDHPDAVGGGPRRSTPTRFSSCRPPAETR